MGSQKTEVFEGLYLFFYAEPDLEFRPVWKVFDIVHLAGADHVATESRCVEISGGQRDRRQIDFFRNIPRCGWSHRDEWCQDGTEQYECRDHANRERCSTHAANSPTIIRIQKTSESAHFFEGDHDGRRESLGVRLHRVADRRKHGGIFFEIGRALRHRWLRAIDHR